MEVVGWGNGSGSVFLTYEACGFCGAGVVL